MKKILLITAALLLVSVTFAQEGEILYFDLDPDSTRTFRNWEIPDPPICLDIDRDGICEWRFQSRDGGHQSIGLLFSPNTHPHPEVDTLEYYTKLRISYYNCHLGDTTTNLEWGNYPELIIENLGDYPNKMLALRYQVEGGYCYGWMRFSASLYDPAPMIGASRIDLAIHEMAYCTIPDYPLCVGQTDFTWTIDENAATAFATLHPNPTNGLVTILGKDLKTAEVFNALGQHVATATGKGERITVDISNLPAGIYFVNITDGEGRKCVRKVVKE